MSVVTVTEKIFTWFGEKITPAFVSASIAGAKGIFRPIFTLSDPKQDKATKSYAALREGLTELIAIPVYLGSGAIATSIAKKKACPEGMTKDLFNKIVNSKKEFDLKELAGTAFEKAQSSDISNLRKNFFKMKGTLSMLGVFASALIVIPALCSVVIKPIMKATQKNNNKQAISPETGTSQVYKQNTFKGKLGSRIYPDYTVGMKVGGV